jgi:hypothetical protein
MRLRNVLKFGVTATPFRRSAFAKAIKVALRSSGAVALVLILTLATFAMPGSKTPTSDAHAIATFAISDIPPEVLDPDFIAWQPPYTVRMFANPRLSDIAVAGADAFGPYIVYNPVIVSQVPPRIVAFYFAHEYGHIYLGTSNENAAAAFAAQTYAQVDPRVVRATAWWMTYVPNGGDFTHPPSPVRAVNICRVSGMC